MPIIKSAQKKMRKDKKREAHNNSTENKIKALIKNMRRNPSSEIFGQVSSILDKAVKTNLIHSNRSARLKSRLSKLISTE